MKLYREVVQQSWKFTTTQPALWIFGLFAIFLFGIGGEIDRYLRYVSNIMRPDSILNPQFWMQSAWVRFITNTAQALEAGNTQVISFVILFVLSCCAVLYMIMVAQGALIYAAGHRASHRHGLSFSAAYTQGAQHAVTLFFLNLISGLIITVCSFLLVSSVMNATPGATWLESHSIVVVASSLVFIPLVLIVSFISRYAANYIVLEKKHLLPAIQSALNLLRRNWLITIEMALYVFVLTILGNIGIVLGITLLTMPYITSEFIMAGVFTSSAIFNMIFVSGIMYALVLILFSSIFSTWQWVAWVILFQRLHTEKHTGKLVRILSPKAQ